MEGGVPVRRGLQQQPGGADGTIAILIIVLVVFFIVWYVRTLIASWVI
jgi:hypothetical protein